MVHNPRQGNGLQVYSVSCQREVIHVDCDLNRNHSYQMENQHKPCILHRYTTHNLWPNRHTLQTPSSNLKTNKKSNLQFHHLGPGSFWFAQRMFLRWDECLIMTCAHAWFFQSVCPVYSGMVVRQFKRRGEDIRIYAGCPVLASLRVNGLALRAASSSV